jgi:hypothetical protein
VIADLSAYHVERQALLCGYSVEQIRHDYGIDLLLTTYNDSGEYENGEIRVQLKATDHLKVSSDGQYVTVRVEREDLHCWLGELMPVVLAVYDAHADVAYWLYVQECLEAQPGFNLHKAPARVTVRLPRANVIDQAAVRQFAAYRDAIFAQAQGVIRHG